jgi:hypothetical protein
VGITIKVNKVDDISPPITTIANSLWTSKPVPVVITSNNKPNAVVIKTGLSFDKQPVTTVTLQHPAIRN